MPNINILSVIIYKLSYWQEFYPVILLKVDINLEVYFYCTVFTLGLLIDWSIKYGRKLILDFDKIVK